MAANVSVGGYVSVALDEYLQLVRDSEFLGRLRSAGVDNWEGFYDASCDQED